MPCTVDCKPAPGSRLAGPGEPRATSPHKRNVIVTTVKCGLRPDRAPRGRSTCARAAPDRQ